MFKVMFKVMFNQAAKCTKWQSNAAIISEAFNSPLHNHQNVFTGTSKELVDLLSSLPLEQLGSPTIFLNGVHKYELSGKSLKLIKTF